MTTAPASTAPASTAEALALIEAASSPADLFGNPGNFSNPSSPARVYRRLVRLTHPDRSGGDPRAAAAFARLTGFWRSWHDASDTPLARGDIANLYPDRRGLVKLARDPVDNDLINAEATALRRLAAHGDPRYLPYVPSLAGTERRVDPATGITRHANVIARLAGFCTLAEVHAAYPDGVDPRDAAWMWRRLLVAIGLAHRTGLVHGAVLPEHVLIQPQDHGLVLIDWCYSARPGGIVPAIVSRYRDWYPPDVLARQPAAPGADIWLAARCMRYLMGERAPRLLRAFGDGCMLASPWRRPDDAWQLLAELDQTLERSFGPRQYHPFVLHQ